MMKSSPDIAVLLNPKLLARVQPLPRLLAWFSIVTSVVTLLAHTLKNSFLSMLSGPSWATMRVSAAVGIILAAAALLLSIARSPKEGLIRTLSLLAGAIGFLALIREPIRFHASLLTAFNLILLGSSLVLLKKAQSLSHVLAFAMAMLGTLPLIAYAYGSRFSIGVATYGEMAPDTSICFVALAIAILFASSDHDLAAVVVSDGPGGTVARRLLPVAVLFPFLLGWVRVAGESSGVLSLPFGTAFFVTATIVGFLAFIWKQSVAIQRSEVVHRATLEERERLRIEGEIREQFVSFFTHDLRTPLTAATAQADLIARYPMSAESSKRNAEKVLASLRRIDGMIQDLLDVKRAGAGKAIHLWPEKTDLRTLLGIAIGELAVVHGDRFDVDCPAGLGGILDAKALRRAIENLCNNAVKYGDPVARVAVRGRSEGGRIFIAVHNEGPPIPVAEQPYLFEPFRRSRSAERKGGLGWGIGLAQVRAMAEAHGGRVSVESAEGKGTTFTIDLPVEAARIRKLVSQI